ncbi:hypothetical protein NEISUBOT_03697 [Neisseria subflava NJ9703]|uniref:Uncharacterized protein n=1 Tax=Neisseria subflava NJ9703 TaxID=546268 RepID=A0A9W5ISE1_NEISU|nr:hypothetical protein NEISUBOT_03697 [Neisseria subflava NJ9703]
MSSFLSYYLSAYFNIVCLICRCFADSLKRCLFKLLTIFASVSLSAYWECGRNFVNKKGGLVGIKKQRVCVLF